MSDQNFSKIQMTTENNSNIFNEYIKTPMEIEKIKLFENNKFTPTNEISVNHGIEVEKVLLSIVDEKYLINDNRIKKICQSNNCELFKFHFNKISKTLDYMLECAKESFMTPIYDIINNNYLMENNYTHATRIIIETLPKDKIIDFLLYQTNSENIFRAALILSCYKDTQILNTEIIKKAYLTRIADILNCDKLKEYFDDLLKNTKN